LPWLSATAPASLAATLSLLLVVLPRLPHRVAVRVSQLALARLVALLKLRQVLVALATVVP